MTSRGIYNDTDLKCVEKRRMGRGGAGAKATYIDCSLSETQPLDIAAPQATCRDGKRQCLLEAVMRNIAVTPLDFDTFVRGGIEQDLFDTALVRAIIRERRANDGSLALDTACFGQGCEHCID